ncbi:unnamed protein product [Ophioblennius macclurei]
MSVSKKKGPKTVSQQDLRRLMRETQRQSADRKQRVQSPFARYSAAGQLSCGLCGSALKSELLWPAHVLGKQHKEKLAERKEAASVQPEAPRKRRAPHAGEGEGEGEAEGPAAQGKRARPADGAPASSSSGRSTGLSLLAGVYDNDDDDNEEEEEEETGPPQQPGLPADFFDSSIPSSSSTPAISHSGSIQKADAPPPPRPAAPQDKKEKMAEALPEGFFDDPVRDAKVRNVDAPKDQMDKEWEEFQKEIRQVNTKSEAMVAEEDEEGRLERQIDEIDQQIECFKRVEVLRDRREVLARRRASSRQEQVEDMETGEEQEEEDEEQLLGLLSRDWRAKGALA